MRIVCKYNFECTLRNKDGTCYLIQDLIKNKLINELDIDKIKQICDKAVIDV